MDHLERAVAKALADAESPVGANTVKDSNVEPKATSNISSEVVGNDNNTTAVPPGNTKTKEGSTTNLDNLAPVSRVHLETIDQGPLTQHLVDDQNLKRSRIVGHLTRGKGANIYTMLRSQVLLKMRNHSCKSLALIGPHEGAGKSSVAANLAMSIARKKVQPVVLVDLDLRKPSQQNVFGVEPTHQIASYLNGSSNISQICISTQYEGLHLCLSGHAQENAAELLDGPRAKTLIPELQKLLEDPIIIVDFPPILGVSDVHTFLPNCDAALLVVEYGRTTKAEIEATLRLLGTTSLVGSVVNKGQLDSDASYGYGYGSSTEERS